MPKFTFPNGHVVEALDEFELVEKVQRYAREHFHRDLDEEEIIDGSRNPQ
ncbi:hypothetical protein [Candidatus Nanohalococcus occultus]|uniref:Uncharacterized protein n=1 Tax=Candidatus Nanohalococcus occultus TaxID=2978047 RepID=A0ABY8CIB7_9ARCH|nr:hypothetical protein SVXNc_0759 [Candidatus Nanohaloarchaeota archaeon SVXNc]